MRLKGLPFQFFSALWDFFSKTNSPKIPSFNFFDVLQENECWKIPKGWKKYFSVFSAFWDFFRNFFSPIFFTLQFFDVLQQWNLKNAKGSPFSAPVSSFGFFVGLILFLWYWYFEFWHHHVLLLFLSLRYGADLCRSRLFPINFENEFDYVLIEIIDSANQNFFQIGLSGSSAKWEALKFSDPSALRPLFQSKTLFRI